jgi:IclR family transcriptional regulator, KDG regulon repressor
MSAPKRTYLREKRTVPPPKTGQSRLEIKSLRKALLLLKLFSRENVTWPFDKIAAALKFHKSSVQRIVATLETHGFLSKVEPGKGIYRLGPEIIFLGNLAEMSLDLRSVARPVMVELVERVQESCYLCVADRQQCFYVEIVECSQPVRIITAVGQRNYMHCTGVGKVLLSGLDIDEIDKVITEHGLKAYTPNTITNRKRLMQELKHIRSSGISIDNEEWNLGIRCVAAPVKNASGRIVAALSLSGPTQRITPDAVGNLAEQVRSSAGEISRLLGFIG